MVNRSSIEAKSPESTQKKKLIEAESPYTDEKSRPFFRRDRLDETREERERRRQDKK